MTVLVVTMPRPLAAGESASRRWLGASLLVAPAWVVGYRIVTSSGPAKIFRLHVRSLALIGRTMIGWLGFDVARPAFGTLAVAVVLLGSCAAAWRGRNTVVRLAGGALLGYLIVDVVTLWFFDLGYAAFSERALLPVRCLLIVMVAAQIAHRFRRVHRHALTASVAALLAVWFVPGQLQTFDVGVVPYVPARVVASVPPNVPILTYLPDRLYLDVPRPMIGLPQAIEPSTGQRLDIRAQATALVGALRESTTRAVVVIPSQLFVQEIRNDQWPSCARILRSHTVAGTVRYELDIERCPPSIASARR